MQVERETLARAHHHTYCHKRDTCDEVPDEHDYDMADLWNEILEKVPASAVIL